MDEPSIAKESRSRFSRIMIAIVGLIIIAIVIPSFYFSALEFTKFRGEEIYASFFCAVAIVLGLCFIFPSIIGTRVRSYLKVFLNWITSPIRKYRPEGGYWENKYFLATGSFGLSLLQYYGVSSANENTPEWKYIGHILGMIGFAAGGMFIMMPKAMATISKVGLWLLGAFIVCALIYVAVQAASSLSIPAAILIGAVIIAYALSARK